MANVKQGQTVPAPQWWKHLREWNACSGNGNDGTIGGWRNPDVNEPIAGLGRPATPASPKYILA